MGQNLRIDYRWGAGDAEAMRRYAAELVALAPDVILAHSSAAVAPLLKTTQTIPVVFTLVAEPVGAGFVRSLAKPGGNATGFTNFEYGMGGKWLELLKETRQPHPGGGHSRIRHRNRARPVRRHPGRRAGHARGSAVRSTCAMPAKSNATSRRSRKERTAA